MLPKSRIFSVLLLGLGCALLVGGLLQAQLGRFDARLPLDPTRYTWTLVDPEATISDLTLEATEKASVTKQVEASLIRPSDEDTATIRLATSVRRTGLDDLEGLHTAAVSTYTFDRITGEILSPIRVIDQLAGIPRDTDTDGVWWKFPTAAEKTSYMVFDETLATSYPAVYESEVEEDGRTMMAYRQIIDPEKVNAERSGLLTTLEIDGQPAYLEHAAERVFYVDRESGVVVDLEEQITDIYRYADGEQAGILLDFNGRMTEQNREDLRAAASEISRRDFWRTFSYILAALGALSIIAGGIGSFRRGRG
ncbi:DUF3068 domain-containing protein [Corynebacterium sp. ES2794-CONJ1]|uniref:DUF3068 domain-containing protein n=1 Tax=unclassified Corynebacterium TaxID=2624378 RepID=UPI00216B33A9|nr:MULTISPECIES: DUF3068 domain-containing protein [unclassified Corynebacterium]MCS4531590.1 DUF3068 domain-containing protein [Corynebacterium sp. ES2730-CONJ]MCU9518986.1 DUF3068 domain-containing protein [Corynebacterium sp. ES2794-CONJ1]